ncbi:MAG: response regulator [Desulfobulbaceae bacterium]|nr:response regulator [Desulfobulbaceae bacterium]
MKKVLIIDDDPDVRDVLTTTLGEKYDVKQAASRETGAKALKEFVPDLVVLDVMMEEYDSGFEMAREIKHDEQLKHVKILMLTSIDTEMDIDFKEEAGDPHWLPVDDYVVKPPKPNEFLEKVEELVGK